MSRTSRQPAILFAALAVLVFGTAAVADHPKAEVGFLGGLVFPDEDAVGHGPDADDWGFGFGLTGNYFLDDNWAIFGDGLISSLSGQREQFGDVSSLTLRVGPRIFVPTVEDRLSFFFDASLGYTSMDFDIGEGIVFLTITGGHNNLIDRAATPRAGSK